MPNDLLVERMTGYCDGPHVKEKLNILIDAHNKLVRQLEMLERSQVRGYKIGAVKVDEFVGISDSFNQTMWPYPNQGPQTIKCSCLCSTCVRDGGHCRSTTCLLTLEAQVDIGSKPFTNDKTPAELEMIHGIPLTLQARGHARGGKADLTDLEILNFAHVLKLWGWVCRCVAPSKIVKGPVVLCQDCSRLVVEEESD